MTGTVTGTGATEAPGNSAPRGFRSALIVDDHPLFCDALSMTLGAVAGISAIDQAGTLGAALDLLDGGLSPDVVILDLHLPDVQGLDGLIRLHAAAPGAPLLVVSSMTEDRLIALAMRSGAAGFVPKHSGKEVFRAAFAALSRGRPYLPDVFTDPGADPLRDDVIARLATLTRQQGRILQLICAGKLNKQIAWDLQIAETTVKAHVTAIMRKLGVQSRTQAVLVAQEATFTHVLQD